VFIGMLTVACPALASWSTMLLRSSNFRCKSAPSVFSGSAQKTHTTICPRPYTVQPPNNQVTIHSASLQRSLANSGHYFRQDYSFFNSLVIYCNSKFEAVS